MTGETDLDRLVASMAPTLREGVFVFASLPHGARHDDWPDALMTFREREGVTLILDEAAANRAGLESTFRCRLITLDVQSSLAATGFMAAIATALAAAGIATNPVAGFFHDHLFVPTDRADEALELLSKLAATRPI